MVSECNLFVFLIGHIRYSVIRSLEINVAELFFVDKVQAILLLSLIRIPSIDFNGRIVVEAFLKLCYGFFKVMLCYLGKESVFDHPRVAFRKDVDGS